jgi:hypothetical protein
VEFKEDDLAIIMCEKSRLFSNMVSGAVQFDRPFQGVTSRQENCGDQAKTGNST